MVCVANSFDFVITSNFEVPLFDFGSPQWQWERTPNAGYGGYVRRVYDAGVLNDYVAHGSSGVAPACNVI